MVKKECLGMQKWKEHTNPESSLQNSGKMRIRKGW